MFKKGWVYIVIAIITLGLIFLIEYNKPKKINWSESYVSHHKIPYGTYVFNDLMEKYFPSKTKQVRKPPFEFLSRNDSIEGTYIFVNRFVDFGEAELNTLLDWTSKGNTLFIASDGFEEQLLDTLNLEQYSIYSGGQLNPLFYHELVNPGLQTDTISFEKDYYTLAFDQIDTLNTIVLGQVYAKPDSTEINPKNINIVKQPFGNGEIILSTFPKAFTNYFILKDENKDYTAGLLSYLDKGKSILMDNHHKSGKSFYTSPMYLFLNTKELKWAYYLVLIGALVYVIFEGKRKQRAIPVVAPLKNQTLAFTRTIADMYFESGEQKKITEHKVAYFLEYIRTKLYMATQDIDESFLRRLATRSNNTLEDVQQLFALIHNMESKEQITDMELQQLNKKIEAFKAKVDGK
ncbi:DUF4350 domain-containing protein [Flagellimonas sp. 389]|uniref:DUF4350 domain-containing protein n=1 Tax=Flagellimonas sp. 389 TaxID=2835862 RepID=UPI001BD2D665|nr:DUF4350 domain-containing protein [Flagellimonas sp. 389]MBS9463737.1 DUF4350 domain-containing protein [Flagellimonas sp. 389]